MGRSLPILAVAMTALLALTTAGCSAFGADLPAKPADYVEVLDMDSRRLSSDVMSSGGLVPEDEGVLLGPNFGIFADWAGAVESLSDDDAEALGFAEPFRAANDHELLMLSIADDPRWEGGRWKERDAKLEAALLIGERVIGERKVELKSVPKPGSLIIASVPKGASAKLSVTDNGRAQSLDLRTGTRAPDAIRWDPAHQLNAKYQGSGRVSGYGKARDLDVDITIESAQLEPYLPGQGWAKPGRAWLLLNLSQVYSTGLDADLGEPTIAFFVEPSKTFRLSWQGGTARAAGGRGLNTLNPAARYLAVFEVPASFRGGSLTITPDGPLFTYRGSSALTSFTNLSRVPDCGGPVVCLAWERRPEREVVKVGLE
jgi:hypothetical protein